MACPVITLGGVVLNPNILWRDRETPQLVAQNTVRTLSGSLIVYTQGLVAGQEITLTATADQGWLTKTQVNAIKALAEVPGASYTFSIDAEVHTVMFRHSDAPAFEANLLIERLNPDPTDYYTATIKLRKI